MPKKQQVTEKVRDVCAIISSLEKKIAEEEKNYNGADSIKDKIFQLKRKLGMFREILRSYPSVPFNNQHLC